MKACSTRGGTRHATRSKRAFPQSSQCAPGRACAPGAAPRPGPRPRHESDAGTIGVSRTGHTTRPRPPSDTGSTTGKPLSGTLPSTWAVGRPEAILSHRMRRPSGVKRALRCTRASFVLRGACKSPHNQGGLTSTTCQQPLWTSQLIAPRGRNPERPAQPSGTPLLRYRSTGEKSPGYSLTTGTFPSDDAIRSAGCS